MREIEVTADRLMIEINHLPRRAIFEENVVKINRHNLESDIGLHTYTLEINNFADIVCRCELTVSIFVANLLNYSDFYHTEIDSFIAFSI